jgi:hypothetical protein
VNVCELLNPPHMDLLLALAGLGDIVGGLHLHKRVHLHPKSFLNAERHIARKISLAVQQAGKSRPRNPKGRGGGRYRQASRLDDLRANKISGMSGFFIRSVYVQLFGEKGHVGV